MVQVREHTGKPGDSSTRLDGEYQSPLADSTDSYSLNMVL